MGLRSSDIYLNALCLAAYAPGGPSTKIAKAVVSMYDSMNRDEQTVVSPISKLYVKLLREVSESKIDLSNRAEATAVLLQFQDDPAFQNSKFSIDELKDTLLPETAPSPQKIKLIFNKVKNNIIFFKTGQRIRKMMLASQKGSRCDDDEEKQATLLKDLLADAETLRVEIETNPSGEDDAVVPVDEIDFSNRESVMRALKQQRKKREGSLIKFGIQGFNRMFGPRHAAVYGETMAVAARSHNGKSEMLMSMARWHATLNDPPNTNGKKPIILFISLENEIGENLMKWFKTMYTNSYHKFPEGLSDDEVVDYVMRMMNSKGYLFLVFRKMGDNFGFHEYVDLVNRMEQKYTGKVVATYLDYITLCKRCPEDQNENPPKQLQMLVRRFKDFCNHGEQFFCTGLQLETEAARLASSGQTNIVKRYNESHLADAKAIKQELDILVFLEIENNHKGVPWMTMCISKHKYVDDTPAEDKYTAYKFTDLGILNDIDGEDRSSRDIYAEDEDAADQTQTQELF